MCKRFWICSRSGGGSLTAVPEPSSDVALPQLLAAGLRLLAADVQRRVTIARKFYLTHRKYLAVRLQLR